MTTDARTVAAVRFSSRDLVRAAAFVVLFLLLAVLVVLPLCALLLRGFTSTEAGRTVVTLDAFRHVLTDRSYWASMGNTLVISVGATVLAATLGVFLAWSVVRTNVPYGGFLERIATVPIFIPPFIGAFAWILLAAPRIGVFNMPFKALALGAPLDIYTYTGMVWVMGVYIAPYVMMIVAGALRNMDPSLEEAGQVAGLSRARTMRVITLPVIAPSILSGAVLAFVISIGLLGTPVLLGLTKQIYLVTSRIYLELQHFPVDAGVVSVLALYLMLLSISANVAQRLALKDRSFITVTGKGFRPHIIMLGGARHLIAGGIWLYLVLTVFAPILIIAAAAFSTYAWSGKFTWSNIAFLWESADALATLRNSLVITVIAATATTIFGIAVAWITTRTRIRGRQLIEDIVLLPMAVPSIAFALAVAAFWLWAPQGWSLYGTIWIIIIGLIGRYSSYATRAISSSLIQIHPELEESARVSGYGWGNTLRRITLPLVFPSIVASWVMVYSIFISELSMVLPLYTAETRTLSILSFDVWSNGLFTQVASISLAQLVIGVGVVFAISAITRRREMAAL
jgi:iron(III) transport system permease protein